ncbi:MAG TPA: DNA-3-methyladenine glycosylase [Acidimicrobiales bacterium]|nr:DNA-3-methyladenine glycosylase [Acidimicrobiales bacterium]
MPRLARSFFARDPDAVARDLVGATLVVRAATGLRRAVLVEVEAYGDGDDPASHAYRGPTPRAAVMFESPGRLYVYRIYGLHWCANVVAHPRGRGGAVLLRAAELPDGERSTSLRGPGVLARELGLTGEDTGVDCCARGGRAWLLARDRPFDVATSRRIGLTKAVERVSRYYAVGHPAVSGPRATLRSSRS